MMELSVCGLCFDSSCARLLEEYAVLILQTWAHNTLAKYFFLITKRFTSWLKVDK